MLGKSTTLKLISRLLKPTSGEIIIDDYNINDITLDSLRQRIAVIPQDTCLFDNTMKYNLMFGNINATNTELDHIINKCNLQPIVNKLSNGLDTELGERGARLSGGEKQKVSIAR